MVKEERYQHPFFERAESAGKQRPYSGSCASKENHRADQSDVTQSMKDNLPDFSVTPMTAPHFFLLSAPVSNDSLWQMIGSDTYSIGDAGICMSGGCSTAIGW